MDRIEALAEAWASMDGRLERFRACKEDAALDDVEGRYQGYMADAREMLRRIESRGYTLTPAPEEPGA